MKLKAARIVHIETKASKNTGEVFQALLVELANGEALNLAYSGDVKLRKYDWINCEVTLSFFDKERGHLNAFQVKAALEAGETLNGYSNHWIDPETLEIVRPERAERFVVVRAENDGTISPVSVHKTEAEAESAVAGLRKKSPKAIFRIV